MSRRTSILGRAHTLHQALAQLDRSELEARVRSMANAGIGEYTIAELLKLHVDQVRKIMSDHTDSERGT